MTKSVFSLIILLAGGVGVSGFSSAAQGATDETEVKTRPVDTEMPTDAESEAPGPLNEVARFIAGLPLEGGSKLAAQFAGDDRYQRHVRSMNSAWDSYELKNLTPMATWASQHLAELPDGPVFYPFSGPDIVNAVHLLPGRPSYTLLALEEVGVFPVPSETSPSSTLETVEGVAAALRDIMGMNFFRTNDMKVKVGSREDNGVAAILLFFLARSGQVILDGRLVALTESGELTARSPEEVGGVEIRFRPQAGGNSSRVVYFPGDVSDPALHANAGLLSFIRGQGGLVSMAKAASYLMSRSSFDDIRNLTLARSVVLIEDASAVPYSTLTADERFGLDLWGSYSAPIPLFESRCQPSLVADSKKARGPLPFSYGYNYKSGSSHLIVARRKAESSLGWPEFDKSYRKGTETTCSGGKLNVQNVK